MIDKRRMNRIILYSLLFKFFTVLTVQATTIHYHIGWEQANSHYFKISVEVSEPDSQISEFRIPAWRPGIYLMQNFTRNVFNVKAVDGIGRILPVTKINKDTWRVENGSVKRFTFKYDYYARQLDAGASYLAEEEAYINPVSLLMYLPGREMQPVTLSLQHPQGWRIATAMDADEKSRFTAENYHELADSPILISPDFKLLEFAENNVLFQLALQGEINFDTDSLVNDVSKIVRSQMKIMQTVPFKRYLFLYHLVNKPFGHGVEHKNSTSIVSGPSSNINNRTYRNLLGTTSHEFFHAWNVERIRPQSLYHPDYSTEAYTGNMWFFEGGTSYYDVISRSRAGMLDRQSVYRRLAGNINRLQQTYGRKLRSVYQVGLDSWGDEFKSPPHTGMSYYLKGSVVTMLLDLAIRRRTDNDKSLDDVMRYLYEKYAAKDRGMPEDGIQKAVEKITGQSFHQFFSDFVYGTKEIDYNRFLNYAGLQAQVDSGKISKAPYTGISTYEKDGRVTIRSVMPESPALFAGMDIDDVLVSVNSRKITLQNVQELIKKYQPGDTLTFTIIRNGGMQKRNLIAAEPVYFPVKLIELPEAGTSQTVIRESWLTGMKSESEN